MKLYIFILLVSLVSCRSTKQSQPYPYAHNHFQLDHTKWILSSIEKDNTGKVALQELNISILFDSTRFTLLVDTSVYIVGRYFVKDDSTFSLVYAGAGKLEKYFLFLDEDFVADNHMINHLNYVNTKKIWTRYRDQSEVLYEIWDAFKSMKSYTLQENKLLLKSSGAKISRTLHFKQQSPWDINSYCLT